MRRTIVLIAAAIVLLGGGYALVLHLALPQSAPSPDVGLPPVDVVVSAAEGEAVYEVVSGQSSGRYLVREQLAGFSLPIDAIGTTTAVTGRVGFTPSGAVAEGSQIVVNLSSLASDESRRDQYVRQNILQTQRYPYATFVPKEVRGLPQPVPASGTAEIVIVGDLTIRDVTRQVVWEGTASFAPDGFHVTVRTAFPFSDFNLTKPRVAIVLSVDDQIRLEAEIRLRPV